MAEVEVASTAERRKVFPRTKSLATMPHMTPSNAELYHTATTDSFARFGAKTPKNDHR
jgi:hypothetical protein